MLVCVLCFVLLATYHTWQPTEEPPGIVIEPESIVVLESTKPKKPPVLDPNEEKLFNEPFPNGGVFAEVDETEDGTEDKAQAGQDAPAEPNAPSPKSTVPAAAQPEATGIKPHEPNGPTTDSENWRIVEPAPYNPKPPPPPPEPPGPEPMKGMNGGNGEPKENPPPEKTSEEEPAPTTKIVVMGKLSTEDTDWVTNDLTDWQNAIYHVDLKDNETSPTDLRTKMNKAREAMPYLTYIIDNYPSFPDVVAFIHPHRRGMPMAWHNDARSNDAVNMLRDLRLDTVLDRGYVNLRCNNEVGCPDEVQPFRDPPDPDRHAEHAFPYVYGHFFNATFTEMREEIPVVATQCCAQFALSKEQLLKKPKQEYERYRSFLEETHYDDATSGRVMEYMWHIIFGREAVHCENVFDCWCAVYGRCFGNMGGGRGGFARRPP